MGELRLVAFLSSLALLAFCPQDLVSPKPSTPASVSGRVVYEDGRPVKDAEVELFFYYLACGGIGCNSPSSKTNSNGEFTLQTLPSGEGVVTASKEEEGFPNAQLILYGRTGYDSLKPVDVTPGSALQDLVLRFNKPNATVTFVVRDAATMLPVQTAGISISLADDQRVYKQSTIPKTGVFDFVLPTHGVAVTINAPGYADWMFSDRDGNKSLLMAQGTHRQVLVTLNKK